MNNNYRKPGLFGGFSLFPPVIKYLLIANLAVFILEHFLLVNLRFGSINIGNSFFKLFALQPLLQNALLRSPISGPFYPWQLFTYMFMHGDFSHIFFNMFALWMFGMELENLWGSKKFLLYYTICGLGAGLSNLLLAPLFTHVGPTVGASGSIYGILVAFGYLFPDRFIYIYFLMPIKAKYLVILYMALEVFAVASQSDSGIAHIAHLGGAVVGFVYLVVTGNRRMSLFNNTTFSKKDNTPPPQFKAPVYNANYKDINEKPYVNEEDLRQKVLIDKLNEVLDKLSKSGYQSLTDEEKKILFEESKKIK